MEPRYTHSCSKCTFLGQYNEYDLYHCIQVGGMPTVIARYSDDGPDYMSGLRGAEPGLNLVTSKVETCIPLAVAKDRAIERGLRCTSR